MSQPAWKKTGKNQFILGENRITIMDHSIVYIEVIGEQTDEHARLILENLQMVMASMPGKIKQLVNLNQSGKSSLRSREVFKHLNDENISEKVAVFGIHPVARVLAMFVTGLTLQKNVRFFTNEEEALSWLRISD
jgi:hypothetical protein